MGMRRSRRKQHFLKGPIRWSWIAEAAALPGRALAVGMVLRLWAGMRCSQTVRLSYRNFPAGLSRFAIYRGLRNLERAGLVTVRRVPGHAPLVTLPVDDDDDL
jgi:hypothetical protein